MAGPDVVPEQAAVVDHARDHADVGGAMTRISPELRVVLQLIVLDGLTTREAAVLLKIPRGTVKTRLIRARVKMREELA